MYYNMVAKLAKSFGLRQINLQKCKIWQRYVLLLDLIRGIEV